MHKCGFNACIFVGCCYCVGHIMACDFIHNLNISSKVKFLGVLHVLHSSAFIGFKGEEFAVKGRTEQLLSRTG